MTKKITIDENAAVVGSGYPAPFDAACARRIRLRLSDAAGLEDFGVNLMTLPPGAWSSQRHWHTTEDEFIYVLRGEVTLVSDTGEETLRAGDCAGFKAGSADGHHLLNRSQLAAQFLEIGSRRADDQVTYSDIDLKTDPGSGGFIRKNGLPV